MHLNLTAKPATSTFQRDSSSWKFVASLTEPRASRLSPFVPMAQSAKDVKASPRLHHAFGVFTSSTRISRQERCRPRCRAATLPPRFSHAFSSSPRETHPRHLRRHPRDFCSTISNGRVLAAGSNKITTPTQHTQASGIIVSRNVASLNSCSDASSLTDPSVKEAGKNCRRHGESTCRPRVPAVHATLPIRKLLSFLPNLRRK